jgi:hypothetical protein
MIKTKSAFSARIIFHPRKVTVILSLRVYKELHENPRNFSSSLLQVLSLTETGLLVAGAENIQFEIDF